MKRMTNWVGRLRREGLSPKSMARFHMWATIAFFLLIGPSVLWWKNSVPYLVAISVWANFAGHLSAWQAARVEVKQDEITDAEPTGA